METKIAIYEKYQVGTSIDVLEQEKLRKKGKRPVGIASIRFDETSNGAIYYTIDRVIYFDTVRVTVMDDFNRFKYFVYRIDNKLIYDTISSFYMIDNTLIYDPISSSKGSLERGTIKIKEIRFLNETEEETYIFFSGEEYRGKI